MTAQLLNRSSSSAATAYAHPQRIRQHCAPYGGRSLSSLRGPARLFDPEWEAGGKPAWRLLPPIPAPRGTSDGQRSNRCSALVFPFQFHRALLRDGCRISGRVDPEVPCPYTPTLLARPTRFSIQYGKRGDRSTPYRAVTQAQAIFNNGTALASAYSGEYSLIRSVLFDYPLGTQPPPPTPQYANSVSCVDPTAQAITLTANTTRIVVQEALSISAGCARPSMPPILS